MPVFAGRNCDCPRLKRGRHQRVHGKRVLGHDDIHARSEEDVTEKLDHFVAAVGDEDPVGRHAETRRERAPQAEGAAVGIAMHFARGPFHGRHGLGRWPQRVLV